MAAHISFNTFLLRVVKSSTFLAVNLNGTLSFYLFVFTWISNPRVGISCSEALVVDVTYCNPQFFFLICLFHMTFQKSFTIMNFLYLDATILLFETECSSCHPVFIWFNIHHRFQISTFATKLGVRKIAFLGSGLLLVNYVGSILAASFMPEVSIYLFEVYH